MGSLYVRLGEELLLLSIALISMSYTKKEEAQKI